MRRLTVLWLGVAILAAAACSKVAQEQLPEERLNAFHAAFNAGDAGSIAAFYAEDAILMPPDEPAVKGRAAIEEHFRRSFEQGPAKFEVSTEESFTSGATGVHRGSFTVTSPDNQFLGSYKFLEVWKYTGSEWQLALDMWNTNAKADPPAPPPAPEAVTPPSPTPQVE